MSNIKQSRIDHVLDKEVDFDGVIKTRREWLLEQSKAGSKAEVGLHSPKFNRKKYNSLEGEAQQAYFDKTHKEIPEYRLFSSDHCFYSITKIEYDYYLSLGDQPIEPTTATEKALFLYEEVVNVAGVAEIIQRLEVEQDDEAWWAIAEELFALLSIEELKIVDEEHGWSITG